MRMQTGIIEEKLRGIVERVTYHNPDNGWSVLRVTPFSGHGELVTVTVHQMQVFAGATMEFIGRWTIHPRFGRQFKANRAVELKPADAGALEKYLGSGLIKGVGPKTARKIVRHFGKDTLDVFEHDIGRLTEVPGIARKKLASISSAWSEHRSVREVMMFLQSHGISTLFAVRIYKKYGDDAIALVRENPYRLAADFYGIGFFSADKIALSLGFADNSPLRIRAAVRHVLSAGREQGHCFLTADQIHAGVQELLHFNPGDNIDKLLEEMNASHELCMRIINDESGEKACYYARSLYYDEQYVADRIRDLCQKIPVDEDRIQSWLKRYAKHRTLQLSGGQQQAVKGIVMEQYSVLTGGPGCGKTTTTRVLVALLQAMGKSVLLAAPTGRAAQRMSEVIGLEAATIHRLLEYQGRDFKRNETNPLQAEVLIVDECSMLDISLAASLLKAVAPETAVLFIGDADQLPSVGPGNVLCDIISSHAVPVFHLSEVFRQAGASRIIEAAHQINQGVVPKIGSPFRQPDLWKSSDCLFFDAEEATVRQLQIIARIKRHFKTEEEREIAVGGDVYGTEEPVVYTEQPLELPEQFRHVDPEAVVSADSAAEELRVVLKKVHPWSALYYGLTATDVLRELYCRWVPRYYPGAEIQVLSPMIRGSLGTARLNEVLQAAVNPEAKGRVELKIGEKVFRVGDRVIHRRNNYDLEVFNGDIGYISDIDNTALGLSVSFLPDKRIVAYSREQITELEHAYAVTVHKAQGSEFDVILMPVVAQHYRMLFRNLLYTGLTRARKLAVFVGTRRAFAMAVHNKETLQRQTALAELLAEGIDSAGVK
ncbi:MAG TPA: recombinase RecD [Desulfobulbaceae bacterium]|nr:recombinase RecD [Desulfobulbaceae bacterium]